MTEKLIIARMVKDWVEPYKKEGKLIPKIVFSTHSKFIQGFRLDIGFLTIVLNENYTVILLPYKS